MAERAVPILPSRDLRETLAFYERLGFENRGTPPDEWDYMILGRGGIELHFIAAPNTEPANQRGELLSVRARCRSAPRRVASDRRRHRP